MENIDFRHIADLIDKASRCAHCSELASLAAEEYESLPIVFAKVLVMAQEKAAPVLQTTSQSTPFCPDCEHGGNCDPTVCID